MQNQNFTTSFSVKASPTEVFEVINNVRGWWTGEVEGDAKKVGDELTYVYPGYHYSKQKVVELVPGERVMWHVVDSRLEGPSDPSEWTGTDIVFDISASDGGTEVRFSHRGLVPAFECFERCSGGWGFFVNASLQRLIATGEGPLSPPWE